MKKAFKLFKECTEKGLFDDKYYIRFWEDESGAISKLKVDLTKEDPYFQFSDINELKTFLKSKLAEYAKNHPCKIDTPYPKQECSPIGLVETYLEKESQKQKANDMDKILRDSMFSDQQWILFKDSYITKEEYDRMQQDLFEKCADATRPLNKEMFDNDAIKLKTDFVEYLNWISDNRLKTKTIADSIQKKIQELSK